MVLYLRDKGCSNAALFLFLRMNPTPTQAYLPSRAEWLSLQDRLQQLETLVGTNNDLLTVADVEKIYRCSETTQWRKRRDEPNEFRFIADGGRIKYRRQDLEKYFNKRRS